jgi:hypothetical protein
MNVAKPETSAPVTPAAVQAAAALDRVGAERGAPVLVIGRVGVGRELRRRGFGRVDTVDPPDDGTAAQVSASGYKYVVAVGPLEAPGAPAELIDGVIRSLPRGGCFALTLAARSRAHADCMGRLREYLDAAYAELVVREDVAAASTGGGAADLYLLRRN